MEFKIIILKNCPYSEKAFTLLKKLKKKHRFNINSTTITTEEEKQYYKKLDKIDTFPHVFVKKNIRYHKIGGCSELIEYVAKNRL